MNQKISLGLELDTDAIQKEAQEKLRKRARENMEHKLNVLFHNPRDQASYLFRQESKNSDLSFSYNQIDGMITEKAMDPALASYCQQYIEENFQRCLNEALEEAMEHKARALAFRHVGSNTNTDKGKQS